MKGKDGADIDDQNLMDATLSQQNTQQNLSQPQERKSTDHRTPINLRLLRSAAKKVKEFKTASTDSEVEMQIPSSIPAFDSNTLPLNQNSTDSNNASTFSSSSNDESLNINTLIKPDTEFSNNLNESLAVGSSDIQKEKNTLPLPFPSEASVISFLSEFKNKDQPVFTPHLSCSNSLPLHANEPVRLLDSKTVSPSATSEVLFPSFATTTSPPHAIESAEKSTTPLSSSSFSSFSSNDNKSLHRRLSIHRKHSFAETRRKSPNFISSSDTNSSEESIPTSLLPDHGRQIDLSGFKFRDDSNNPDMKPNPFSRFRLQTKASIDSISSEQVSDSFERHFHQNRDTGISQKSQRKQETSFVGVNKLDDVLKVTTHAIIEIDSDSDSDSQSCQIIDFQKKEKDSDLKSNSSTTETISEKSVFSSQGNSQQLMPSFSTPPFVEQTMYISSIQSNQNPVTTPSPTQMLLAMGIDSDAHQSNDEKVSPLYPSKSIFDDNPIFCSDKTESFANFSSQSTSENKSCDELDNDSESYDAPSNSSSQEITISPISSPLKRYKIHSPSFTNSRLSPTLLVSPRKILSRFRISEITFGSSIFSSSTSKSDHTLVSSTSRKKIKKFQKKIRKRAEMIKEQEEYEKAKDKVDSKMQHEKFDSKTTSCFNGPILTETIQYDCESKKLTEIDEEPFKRVKESLSHSNISAHSALAKGIKNSKVISKRSHLEKFPSTFGSIGYNQSIENDQSSKYRHENTLENEIQLGQNSSLSINQPAGASECEVGKEIICEMKQRNILESFTQKCEKLRDEKGFEHFLGNCLRGEKENKVNSIHNNIKSENTLKLKKDYSLIQINRLFTVSSTNFEESDKFLHVKKQSEIYQTEAGLMSREGRCSDIDKALQEIFEKEYIFPLSSLKIEEKKLDVEGGAQNEKEKSNILLWQLGSSNKFKTFL